MDYQKINRTLTATTTDMVNTSRCFPFAIVNDIAVEEPLECFTVEIFLPANAPDLVRNMVSFQNAQPTCCIQDDDGKLHSYSTRQLLNLDFAVTVLTFSWSFHLQMLPSDLTQTLIL